MTHKKLTVFALAALLIMAMSTFTVVKVFACTQGCTPGFWKNHTDQWYIYSPNQTVGSVFTMWPWHSDYDFLKGLTLMEALQKKGSGAWLAPGIKYKPHQKAARILLRQAVAALLNAAHPSIDYYTPEEVINYTDTRLHYTNATSIEEQKNEFRRYNELGSPICD